jgi:Leucine-rich repeat (LRR) protein
MESYRQTGVLNDDLCYAILRKVQLLTSFWRDTPKRRMVYLSCKAMWRASRQLQSRVSLGKAISDCSRLGDLKPMAKASMMLVNVRKVYERVDDSMMLSALPLWPQLKSMTLPYVQAVVMAAAHYCQLEEVVLRNSSDEHESDETKQAACLQCLACCTTLKKLEVHGVGHNGLLLVHASLSKLSRLQQLIITSPSAPLPDSFFGLTQLCDLTVNSSNTLPLVLPDSIAQLPLLQSLALSGVALQGLPESLGSLSHLKCLTIKERQAFQ